MKHIYKPCDVRELFPNITGSFTSRRYANASQALSILNNENGAFNQTYGDNVSWASLAGGENLLSNTMIFNAHNSNAVYSDNGLVLPNSISKQSYIIYK